jgi:hypothetical protein
MVGRQSKRRHGSEPHTNDETEDAREPASPLRMRVRGKHQPLELSLTQGIAEPVANRPLDLARVGANRSAPNRMDPNVDPKPRRVALIELGFDARPILDQHSSSPSFQKRPWCAPITGQGRLEDQHADQRRERETGFVQLALARIAAIA